jgi:hypothetical protein
MMASKVGNEGLAEAGVLMCQFYYDDASGGYKAFPRRLGLDLNGLQRETTFYFMPDDDPSDPILFEIDTFGPSGSVASILPVLERDYGTAIRIPETLHNSRGDPIENDLYEWRKGDTSAVLGGQNGGGQRFSLMYMIGSMEDKVNRLSRKLWLEGAKKP